MNKENHDLDNKRFIFATIFQLSNALQIYLDKHLKDDNITGKQFLLMIVVGSFGEEGGLLNKVSERSGTSRQNVKQIALKLERNGYLEINKDDSDKRALRLKLSNSAKEYWEKRTELDIDLLNQLFSSTDSTNLDIITKELNAIINRLKEME